jgi:hypothetical protein
MGALLSERMETARCTRESAHGDLPAWSPSGASSRSWHPRSFTGPASAAVGVFLEAARHAGVWARAPRWPPSCCSGASALAARASSGPRWSSRALRVRRARARSDRVRRGVLSSVSGPRSRTAASSTSTRCQGPLQPRSGICAAAGVHGRAGSRRTDRSPASTSRRAGNARSVRRGRPAAAAIPVSDVPPGVRSIRSPWA